MKLNLNGRKFHRLSVIRETEKRDPQGLVIWECLCDCGATVLTGGSSLKKGNTKSCGCLQREAASRNGRGCATHGKTGTRTFGVWGSMLNRCLDKNANGYSRYGGRGITVCARWHDFSNFLADMGEKPEGLSIDRIDNNGNYEPGNCRWATPSEQCNNRESNVFIEHGGRKMTIAQWGNETAVSRQTLYWRARQGWPAKDILEGRQ